jgi:hypothetical protein
MKQLRDNWRNGDIDMALAKTTTRVPLLKMVDFGKELSPEVLSGIQCEIPEEDESDDDDQDYEFSLLAELHKDDHRTAMV